MFVKLINLGNMCWALLISEQKHGKSFASFPSEGCESERGGKRGKAKRTEERRNKGSKEEDVENEKKARCRRKGFRVWHVCSSFIFGYVLICSIHDAILDIMNNSNKYTKFVVSKHTYYPRKEKVKQQKKRATGWNCLNGKPGVSK